MAIKKPLYATRDFNDAGTTRTFERGAELKKCTDGELLNYKAAGLASEEKPKDAPAPATGDEPTA
ncbi:hypothetical protein Q5H91_04150 [Sphingomonas sp. KR1UV-12]|uniref:Uncharacterized protein n=1 Tax=Sphingomonas aurea TaxID=3063994 RepID=A0ABT9EHF8_9SPHN|nr:hypothetical protein [Sphingomonas sp. KR1UV-12]MDP1026394.1 hypothetical protein [Sphingomonas sp. KR1UV-12]